MSYSKIGTWAASISAAVSILTGCSKFERQTVALRNENGIPVAIAVPGKKGFVYNPYYKEGDNPSLEILDIRKYKANQIIDYALDKQYVVPGEGLDARVGINTGPQIIR